MDLDGLEPIQRETTPSTAADRIRRAIVSGGLAPGVQLVEAQLAERLGTSRGSLREALQRLIQEGLVSEQRNRGVFVIHLQAEDVQDIYLARCAVEQAAVRALIEQGRLDISALRAVLADMEDAARANDWQTLADMDLRFHETLVAAAESKRLTRMFRTLVAETRMCLSGFEPHYPEMQDLVAEHTEIVEALARGDVADALAAIDAHLRAAADQLDALGRLRKEEAPS
ncbi:MAG TPA: GntR family transcriptional regulator [Solirubrobacteraceae bacterium]|nr:GntR family transcriptional regulator [Solirubrobacteraceae bacterium]